MKIDKYVKKKH